MSRNMLPYILTSPLAYPRHYLSEIARLRDHFNADIPTMSMFKWFFRWMRADVSGETPLSMGLPWMSYGAIDYLNHHLDGRQRVFEWGAGGSSLFFLRRTAELVSVEHDEVWVSNLEQELASLKHSCHHILNSVPAVTVTPDAIHSESAYTSEVASAPVSFRDYVETIDAYPLDYFDLVVVDGRARNACVKHAIAHVKPGGYLLLDNAERARYQVSVERLREAGWKEQRFWGPSAGSLEFSLSTIWQKPQSGSDVAEPRSNEDNICE